VFLDFEVVVLRFTSRRNNGGVGEKTVTPIHVVGQIAIEAAGLKLASILFSFSKHIHAPSIPLFSTTFFFN